MSVALGVSLARPRDRSHDARRFFGLLALVTAVPLFLLPFHAMEAPSGLNGVILIAWILAGYGHVMTTVWFGIDDGYRPVIMANRQRMLLSLAILPLIMGAVAFASIGAAAWVYVGYTMWLAHHYNRQNFGLVAFAAAHDGTGPIPREVGWFFNLSSVAGAVAMIAMPSIFPGGVTPFGAPIYGYWARIAGAVLLFAGALMLVRLLVRHPAVRRSPTVLLFLGLSLVFYLPSLLVGPANVSFWPYAMAHGAQYLVMMGVVSRGSALKATGLAITAAVAIVLGFAAFSMDSAPWAQIYTGVVMWHFLADARLWRLRDPVVRQVVRERFAFLFEGGPTRIVAGRAD